MRRVRPRSHRYDGRKERGLDTRHRLLIAALREFATHGLRGATTRRIARAARANTASITYHFGGKVRLYQAVAAAIAERNGIALRMNPATAPASSRGKANAAKSLETLMSSFCRDLLTLSDRGASAEFIAQELAAPGVAFPILHYRYLDLLHESVVRLLAHATGRHVRSTDTMILAHALIGTAVGFASVRRKAARVARWPTFNPPRIEQISQQVAHLSRCASAAGPKTPSR